MGSLFDADISEADLDSEQCSLFEAFCNQRLATTPIINRSPYLTGVAVYMFLRHAAEVCVADASSKLVNNESMQLMLDLGSVTMSRIGSGKFDGEIKNVGAGAIQSEANLRIYESARPLITSALRNLYPDSPVQLKRRQFFKMYDDVKLMRDRSSTLFSEEMQTKMKEITDRIDIARPELMGDGTSSFYPPSMKEAEGLVTQLILKYMSLPQEFHNPYSTLDPVKFDSLITGPRCQGETGEQIRKLAKVLLGTMNLGKDCNFTPRVLMPGSTGTGKTSLIFELAESMGAHLIRFNSRQVKEDIEDHQYFTAFRSFAPQINIHSPEIDTPLMDALRMSGVKNPWILIDEFPGRSRLTASLKDLLDQEHSKLGRAIIFIVSNDSIADFDPALVARCIVVPFGKVSRSSKAAVYDKACGTKELPENYIPPYSKIANSIFRLDFSTLAWSEVLQTIPCINQALTPEQVACQKESREKAKQVLLEHRDYVLEKDQDNGVRTVLVTAGYITGLVIGDYPTESSASAKASCASEYLYYDIRRYIDEQAESNKEKMERLMAVESRMYTEGSSGSDSEDDD